MLRGDSKSTKWLVIAALIVLGAIELAVVGWLMLSNAEIERSRLPTDHPPIFDESSPSPPPPGPRPKIEVVPYEPIALPPGSTLARPAENPGLWFSKDDYPPDARRAGEEGRVMISLLIEPDGRAISCSVHQSSGSNALDWATCDLAVRRARYIPARLADGTPVRSSVTIPGIRWQLED